MAVGVLRDGTPVIASGGGDRTVRVRQLADGTPLAHPLDLSEPVWGVALHGNLIVTAVDGDIAIHSQPLHDPYEIASCSAASADRYDHRIMAGLGYLLNRSWIGSCSWRSPVLHGRFAAGRSSVGG